MAQFDSTEVVALMKRRGFVPVTQSVFSTNDFLLAAAEAIESFILPELLKANTKHLIQTQTTALVAAQSSYRVPDRCVNNGIYAVWLQNASGGADPVEEIDPGDVPKLGLSGAAGVPLYYAFEGAKIVLYPTPAAADRSLVVKYQIRPSRLVATTSARVVVAATVPNSLTFTGSDMTGPYDIVRGKGSYEHLALDLTGTAVAGTATLTGQLTAAMGIAAGDYLCAVGETPIPQIPIGLHLPAACRGVATLSRARGNKELAEWLVKEAEAIEKQVLESLVPRNQTQQQAFVNTIW